MESAEGKTLTFGSTSTTAGNTGKALPAGEGLGLISARKRENQNRNEKEGSKHVHIIMLL